MEKRSSFISGWFQRAVDYIDEHRSLLLPTQKAYLNAALFYVAYLLLEPFESGYEQACLAFALFSWGMALTADLLGFYSRLTQSLLGKAVLFIFVGAGANVALAMSSQVVNDLVGLEPSQFVHTITFISIFTAIGLVVVLLSILFVLGMSFAIMYLVMTWTRDHGGIAALIPWFRPVDDIPFPRITATFRVVSFLTVGFLVFSWSQQKPTGYFDFVKSAAGWFLYNFDMYERAPCALQKGQKVAFLDGDKVLLASSVGGDISFAVRSCVEGE